MLTHRARPIVLALVCLIMPQGVRAQVSVTPGAKVRIVDTANSTTLIVGELVRLAGDSVTILPGATSANAASAWAISSQHRRLEVASPRRHTGLGATVGMLVGGAIGKLVGQGSGNCTSLSGACVGMLAGAAIGGLLGYRATTDTWRRVDYCLECVAISPSPGGVMLGWSIAF